MEGLPNGKPLKGRTNIILSNNHSFQPEDGIAVHSKEELFERVKDLDEDAFVTGGESIYNLLYPYCNMAYITKVYKQAPADRRFPYLNKEENWNLIEVGKLNEFEGIRYRFYRYKNNAPKPV